MAPGAAPLAAAAAAATQGARLVRMFPCPILAAPRYENKKEKKQKSERTMHKVNEATAVASASWLEAEPDGSGACQEVL
jgi:hypothetical protein